MTNLREHDGGKRCLDSYLQRQISQSDARLQAIVVKIYLTCREKHAQVLYHCGSVVCYQISKVSLIRSSVPCPKIDVPSPKDPGNKGW